MVLHGRRREGENVGGDAWNSIPVPWRRKAGRQCPPGDRRSGVLVPLLRLTGIKEGFGN